MLPSLGTLFNLGEPKSCLWHPRAPSKAQQNIVKELGISGINYESKTDK